MEELELLPWDKKLRCCNVKSGDLVKIVASDGYAIGAGIYLGERWYDVLETFASYVYFTEGTGWKFSHFEKPWWSLEVIDDSCNVTRVEEIISEAR